MALLDLIIPDIAKTLIGELGPTATLTQRTVGYDPLTGLDSTTESSFTISITPPDPYKQEEVDGSAIQSGDMRIYVVAKGIQAEPLVDNEVSFGSDVYRVVSVGKVMSGASVAIYDLQCRK